MLYAIAAAAALLSATPALAQSLTIQGKVLDASNNPITGTAVQFRVQIKAPSGAKCTLYDETQTLNLSTTGGLFSLSLNDGSGTANTPTTYGLEAAISNRADFAVNSSYCASGSGMVTYHPGDTDNRKIVISFYDPGSMSGFEQIPEMDLNPMAFAMESRTVGGYPASSLLRVVTSGAPGTAPTLSAADATELQSLAAGTSTKYTPASATNGAQIPSFSADPASPPAGSIWYNSTSGELHYRTSGGTQVVGAGGGGGGTITAITVGRGLSGGGSSGSVAVSLPSATANDFLKYDGANWAGAVLGFSDLKNASSASAVGSAVCTAGQTMYYDTTAKELKCQSIGLANSDLSGTLGVAHGGTGLSAGTVGAIPYFSSTSAISLLAAGSNGDVLTMNGSGVPVWQSLPASSFTGTGTINRLAKFTGASAVGNSILADDGTNVGVGTTAPIAKLEVAGSIRLADGGESCSAGANVGMMKYSGGSLFFCNASGWQTLGVSGAGLTSLNGLTANTQTFAIGSAGTTPAWSSVGSVHTLNLPTASASNSGILSSSDWAAFNGKLSASANFAGDVTGTYNANVVTKLQGVAIDTTAPAAGQSLKYVSSKWTPSNLGFGDLKTTGGAATMASAVCNAGQTMYYDSTTGDLKCQSVDLSNASVTGTVAVANGGTGAASTSQNYVFAGPTAGSGAPSFRALTTADISGLNTYWSSVTGGINYAGGNVGVGSAAPSSKLDVSGTLRVADGGEACSGGTNGGMVKYNGGSLYFCNGSAWQQLGVSGAGLTSLNGLTGSTQTFAIGSAGTAPAWSSSGTTHTLNLPVASSANSGILSSSDWTAFNGKLGTASTFAGDVTGTYNATVVTKLQGIAVGTAAPTTGQFLKYGASSWGASNLTFGDVKTTGGAATLASAVCDAGQSMYYDTSTGDLKCQAIAVDNASVTGTLPVSHGGTGASSTSQNFVFAGPATGGSGVPSFRALTAADISGLNTYWTSATGGINYAGGNVGVGTTVPGDNLSVNGQAGVSGASGALVVRSRDATGSLFQFFNPAGGTNLRLWTSDNGSGSAADLVSFYRNGNVGVGTTVPSHKLDVSGNVGLAASSYVNFGTSDGSSGYGLRDSSGVLEFKNSSGSWTALGSGGLTGSGTIGYLSKFGASSTSLSSSLIYDNGTNVGIGTTSPGALLSVAGMIQSTSGGIKFPDGSVQTTAGSASAATAPAFNVNKNGTNQSVAANSNVKVTWSTINFDTINGFDLPNNRYRPSVAGKYIINASVYCQGTVSDCEAQIWKNGVTVAVSGIATAGVTNVSQVVDLNGTTDYVEAYTWVTGSSLNLYGGAPYTNFSGSLIAPLASGSVAGTGTANYLPMWSNSTTLTNSPLAVATANVGVGTTAPLHKLDVSGNLGLSASSYFNFGTTDGSSGYGIRDNGGTLEYKNSGGSWAGIGTGGSSQWTSGTGLIYYAAGNVGIGSSNASHALTVTATADNSEGALITTKNAWGPGKDVSLYLGDTSHYLKSVYSSADQWYSYYGIQFLSNAGTVMSVGTATSGNVGIGSTSPVHTLDVNGNIGMAASKYINFGATDGSTGYGIRDNAGTLEYKNSSGSWTAIGGGGITGSGTVGYLPRYSSSTGLASSILYDTGTNVGIGSTSPGQKLSVAGTVESTSGGFKFPDGSVQTTAASGTPVVQQAAQSGSTALPNSVETQVMTMTVTNGGQYMVFADGYANTVGSWAYFSNQCNLYKNSTAIASQPFYYGAGQTGSSAFIGYNMMSVQTLATGDVLKVTCIPSTDASGAAAANAFNIRIVGTGTGTIASSGSGTANYIPQWISSTGLSNSPMAVSGSNVGIGTTAPAAALDVNGGSNTYGEFIRSSSADVTALGFVNSSSTRTWGLGVGGAGPSSVGAAGGKFSIWDVTAGAARMIIDTAGNVGVGSSAPAAKLDVAGTVSATQYSGLAASSNFQRITASLANAPNGGIATATCPAGYTLLSWGIVTDYRTQNGTNGWNNGGGLACGGSGNTITINLNNYSGGSPNTIVECQGVCARN